MRTLLLAALLLGPAFAGCLGDDPSATIGEAPVLSDGLLLAYQVDDGNTTQTQSFLVHEPRNTPVPIYQLLAFDATEEVLDWPFLELNPALNPTSNRWRDVVRFPLEAGTTHQALADAQEVTVSVEAEPAPAPFTGELFTMNATDADGERVAYLELLAEAGLYRLIELGPANDPSQRWELTDAAEMKRWNAPAPWELGDWWSYNATVFGVPITPTYVHTANKTAAGGSPTYFLEPTDLEDRELGRLFMNIRQVDLMTQSGIVDNLVSKMWRWPMHDGMAWRGFTVLPDEDRQLPFNARVSLEDGVALPDGSRTLAFHIEASTENATEPFAQWNYVPRVGFFTTFHVEHPLRDQVLADWTLTDWGRDFHGPMDAPKLELLVNRSITAGPTQFEDTFAVNETPERLELNGFAGLNEGASPNSTIQLIGPDGEVRSAWDFRHLDGRGHNLRRFVAAEPGNWTLTGNLTQGTSLLFQINALWAEEVQLDFRATDDGAGT